MFDPYLVPYLIFVLPFLISYKKHKIGNIITSVVTSRCVVFCMYKCTVYMRWLGFYTLNIRIGKKDQKIIDVMLSYLLLNTWLSFT